MREIVLDTETTGLDPAQGHKIVEIGCVELENHMPTGRTFQEYLNPEREMDAEVIAVHGITNEFVKDKPKFKEVADKFIEFIGLDSKLVIHNAAFDMKFLNAELTACGREPLSYDRVIDTLLMARQKFPGSRVNLNELCKRFNVDASARTVHGALLDSELLAEVYLELIGGREPGLVLNMKKQENKTMAQTIQMPREKIYHEPRSFPASQDEIEAHKSFLAKIPNNFWESI
ncbi:MAG: DNA polymerase III subunit epsilon [Alphaproteobacteria bacterium]|nr:DNA polymerase III subunit epsilon [Alphaproteobacteria bacterium]